MKIVYVQFAALALVVTAGAQLIQTIGLGEAPVITQQPVSVAVEEGDPARLAISVSGSEPMTYQWSNGFDELAGQTNTVCSFDSISSENIGIYYCSVSNAFGWDLSEVAWLTITGPAELISDSDTNADGFLMEEEAPVRLPSGSRRR